MANSMLVICTAMIAVATLMTAATVGVGIAFAQPQFNPPGPHFQRRHYKSGRYKCNLATVPAGDPGFSQAFCAPDEVVTGGGSVELFNPPANSINPGESTVGLTSGGEVLNLRSWIFDYYNPGPNPVEVYSNAECAKLIDAP
jgi:hypothetical protein